MALLQCSLQQRFRPLYVQSQTLAFPHFDVLAGTCILLRFLQEFSLFLPFLLVFQKPL